MTRLISDLAASTQEMLAAWDDSRRLGYALAFEAALARAQAEERLIATDLADAIARAADRLRPDEPEGLQPPFTELAQEAAHAGTLAIPLVRRLREATALIAPEAAPLVHLGATSQDVADTAMVLQARDGLALIDRDLVRITAALAALAASHRETPMCGRTLLQPAVPVSFGLTCAGWRAAVIDGRVRLQHEAAAALRLQFGGAAGTRAGLHGRGEAIAARMARELAIPSAAPWHARRGGVAALAAALAIVSGALGKIARDISLLSQPEIGEVFEPRIAGRGGSSAMAHKRNPTGCQVALSAALRAPHLAATILSGLPQELERGLGGWQAEAPVVADLMGLAHAAAAAMAGVCEGLEVRPARMADNLGANGLDSDIGESAALVDAMLRRDDTQGAD